MPESGIQMDWERRSRTGVSEATYCASKTPEQIGRIVELADERKHSLLLTRLDEQRHSELRPKIRERLDFDPFSRTAVLDNGLAPAVDSGVGIVSAGTADMMVATEAQRTLTFHGVAAPIIGDVGVAGLWRLLERLEQIQGWRVVIVAAGMEGALFSVVAGQVKGLVIAVPTSVGYGVSNAGAAAMSSALASCAPGIVAVNIDNGFGAACAALKVLATTPAAN